MNPLLAPLVWVLMGILEWGRIEEAFGGFDEDRIEAWGRARRQLEYPNAPCHCLRCYHTIWRRERDLEIGRIDLGNGWTRSTIAAGEVIELHDGAGGKRYYELVRPMAWVSAEFTIGEAV